MIICIVDYLGDIFSIDHYICLVYKCWKVLISGSVSKETKK